MKTSARNVFEGQVSALRPGAINDEVELTLPGGDQLVAVITHRSAQSLGLKVGSTAIALVKAPWVALVVDAGDVRFSARNQFKGTVMEVKHGAVNSEVLLKLPGGAHLVAIVTEGSAQSLCLQVGQDITALVKASSIILGARA